MPADLASSSPSRVRWWQRPPVAALLVTLVLLGAVLAWPLWRALSAPPGPGPALQGLPWQVQPEGEGGSQVFGLHLGRATLADVEALWGRDLVLTLIAAPGQQPALEAYVESFQAAFVTGKLVIAFEAEPGWRQAAWERSPRGDVGEGAVRRRSLAPEDLAQARGLRVQALSLVPSARLDEATVVQRFGAPAERHLSGDGSVQLLYPVTGVAVALPPASGEAARARSLIQYVPPRDFERLLRRPLRP